MLRDTDNCEVMSKPRFVRLVRQGGKQAQAKGYNDKEG